MNPPNIFDVMPGDEPSEWNRLLAESQARKAALLKLQEEVEQRRAASEVERSNLKAALDRSCTTVLQLTAKNAEEKNATRRLCGQQVQTLKALRRLVAAIDQCDRCGWDVGSRSVLTKIIAEANEVIALLDVPFA